MDNNITIVVDTGISQLNNNKLFDRNLACSISHTLMPVCDFYDKAKNLGFDIITPDVYFSHQQKYKQTYLISYLITNETKKLLEAGAKPLALICLESPFIATSFYIKLKKYSSLFKYNFLFPGMKKMMDKKSNFLISYFPQFFKLEDFSLQDFKNKKFLVMISSGKYLGGYKKFIKQIIIKFLYGFGVREIYTERLKAIDYLSDKKDKFDLYGVGWKKILNDKSLGHKLQKCYHGRIESKHDTMKNYKFAICFENTIFPGYVTEKIFDAMFAGVIPIYYGAPDIDKFVPADTFIDYRKFKNWDDLYNFLEDVTEEDYNVYIENIIKFLKSEDYMKFSSDYFSDKLIDLINSEKNIIKKCA